MSKPNPVLMEQIKEVRIIFGCKTRYCPQNITLSRSAGDGIRTHASLLNWISYQRPKPFS